MIPITAVRSMVGAGLIICRAALADHGRPLTTRAQQAAQTVFARVLR